MNKSQLVEVLSTRFEGNKKEAQHALESVLDTITRAVAGGERVAITGFGAFEKVERPSRMVRNPRTGERKRAKKTAVPKFRPGSELKDVVSGARKLPRLSTAKATTAKKTTGTAATKKTAGTKTTGRTTKGTAKTAGTGAAKTTRSSGRSTTRSTAKAPARASAAKATTRRTTSTPATRSTTRSTTRTTKTTGRTTKGGRSRS